MRSTITIKNKTNYFDPLLSRVSNTVVNPDMYTTKKQKIEAYETRLYYEFLATSKKNGATYFYTLTYNDAHVPKYNKKNVFDYDDLRYLLNGAFKKKIERNYHCHFKYFVGAELGEGKGVRGYANNPHYHVLFFVVPENGYSVIDAKSMRDLIQTYWQGFIDGNGDYQLAKFGIARPGDNLGLVDSFHAISYVAKYVTKDIRMKEMESEIKRYAEFKCKQSLESLSTVEKFFTDYMMPRYNPTVFEGRKKKYAYTQSELLLQYTSQYLQSKSQLPIKEWFIREYEPLAFQKYKEDIIAEFVHKELVTFRNRYSNKVRVSQGLGDYALEFIDPMDPSLKVPSKKGYKVRNICGYYFRKLYYDVKKDAKGQNIYVLNDLGQQYKASILAKQLESKVVKMEKVLSFINNASLDNYAASANAYQWIGSIFNAGSVTYSTDLLKKMIKAINNNKEEVLQRYAEYKIIYEGRSFKLDECPETGELLFPAIDPIFDYRRYLVPTYFTARYNPVAVDMFVQFPPEDVFSYGSHPYFHRYIDSFSVLDDLASYYDCSLDSDRREKDSERERLRKQFNNIKFRAVC